MMDEILIKGFNSQRNYYRSFISSQSEYGGDTKLIADALYLYWTELFLFFYKKQYPNDYERITKSLLDVVLIEYNTKQEKQNLLDLYSYLFIPFSRGFNIPTEVTKNIEEEWIRDPIIKACDYLRFPNCIKNYKTYVANIDKEDSAQCELFEWFENDTDCIRSYCDLIRVLLMNGRIQ